MSHSSDRLSPGDHLLNQRPEGDVVSHSAEHHSLEEPLLNQQSEVMSHSSDHQSLEEPLCSEVNASSTLLETQKLSSSSISSAVIEAPSMTGVDLSEFHLFPKLASELRVMIWKLTFPRRRLITLNIVVGSSVKYFSRYRAERFAVSQPIPVALHVNSESRVEALRSYELRFRGCDMNGDGFGPMFFVNYAEDIFRVGQYRWAGHNRPSPQKADIVDLITCTLNREDLAKVRYLMVSKHCCKEYVDGKHASMVNLDELIVETEHYQELADYSNVKLVEEKEYDWEVDGGEFEDEIMKYKVALQARVSDYLKNINTNKFPSGWKAPILKFGRVERVRKDGEA